MLKNLLLKNHWADYHQTSIEGWGYVVDWNLHWELPWGKGCGLKVTSKLTKNYDLLKLDILPTIDHCPLGSSNLCQLMHLRTSNHVDSKVGHSDLHFEFCRYSFWCIALLLWSLWSSTHVSLCIMGPWSVCQLKGRSTWPTFWIFSQSLAKH